MRDNFYQETRLLHFQEPLLSKLVTRPVAKYVKWQLKNELEAPESWWLLVTTTIKKLIALVFFLKYCDAALLYLLWWTYRLVLRGWTGGGVAGNLPAMA